MQELVEQGGSMELSRMVLRGGWDNSKGLEEESRTGCGQGVKNEMVRKGERKCVGKVRRQ